MKQLITAAVLSLILFACNETTREAETDSTNQQLQPGMDLGNQPLSDEPAPAMEETVPVGENATSATYFDAALNDLDAGHPSEAAENMQMAISTLGSEGVTLEDSRHEELKGIIEQLENVTDRLRTDEAVDRGEVKTLIDQAQMLVKQ